MNSDDEDFASTMVSFDGDALSARPAPAPLTGPQRGGAASPFGAGPRPAPPAANEFDAELPTRMAPELHRPPVEAEIGTELFAVDQNQLGAAVRGAPAPTAMAPAMPFRPGGPAPMGGAPMPGPGPQYAPPQQYPQPTAPRPAAVTAQPAPAVTAPAKSGPSMVLLVVGGVAMLGIGAAVAALVLR